ncbi:MAG: NAD-dependent DNA ligase (contains BRCT domain type II), partial [Halonotius sp. J07HN4]
PSASALSSTTSAAAASISRGLAPSASPNCARPTCSTRWTTSTASTARHWPRWRAGARRSAQNLLEEIGAASEPPLDNFLTALSIPEVGGATATALAREFGSLDALIDADTDELEAVDDVGPIVAETIREFFENPENRDAIDALLQVGVDPQPVEGADVGDQLDGLTFVF